MDWERWAVDWGRERALEANLETSDWGLMRFFWIFETRPRTLLNFHKSWHMVSLWFSRSKCLLLTQRQEREEKRDWLCPLFLIGWEEILLSDWPRRKGQNLDWNLTFWPWWGVYLTQNFTPNPMEWAKFQNSGSNRTKFGPENPENEGRT